MEPAQSRRWISCGLDDPVFESCQGKQKKKKLFSLPNRAGWIWVSARLLFSGYRGSSPGLEVDRSTPSRTADKNAWSKASTPAILLIGVGKDYFTFDLSLF